MLKRKFPPWVLFAGMPIAIAIGWQVGMWYIHGTGQDVFCAQVDSDSDIKWLEGKDCK